MDITESVARVKANIAAAAEKAGRRPEDIYLVAASKMNDSGRVREAIAAGIRICGENRVQEMVEKQAQGAYEGAELHFIGHLQKNKVKQVVGLASLIQSADSLELIRLIDKTALSRGIIQDILLEVNIGAEASKSGFSPAELPSALDSIARLDAVRVRGLMTIPPICSSRQKIEPYFVQMKQLFIDICGKKYDNIRMDFLSMGMSADYETAIACGANMVRVGSAIFGKRIYPDRQV
ncbi:MAG: YggS family pyridoxal phosphate-dependent enzyme [Candidatus Limivicinus sp.]|nr:YggS family pyridoxal phosphate-dependent enzyme [Clostridiales bacterium]MDY6133800.1 YggS family pyridoxal phosphate-dependent enzyme [Candidatus Limivicinus sp.]